MPKPRKPLTTDYKYLRSLVVSEFKVAATGDLIRSLLPQDLKDRYEKAVDDLDAEVGVLAYDDFSDKPNTTGVTSQIYAKRGMAKDKYVPITPEKEGSVEDRCQLFYEHKGIQACAR